MQIALQKIANEIREKRHWCEPLNWKPCANLTLAFSVTQVF